MISVIIPTFQRYEWLQNAVCSVLQQTYKNVEIIVIDDCSDDNTPQIVQLAPNIKYYRNDKNCGPGYSRLRGFLCSQGEYVIFLDDDDYYLNNHFFSQALELMESNDDYRFVAANARILHTDTGATEENKLNVIGEISSIDYLEEFPFKNRKPYSTFTAVFRRESLVSAGVDQMEMVNDIAIYMRCLITGGKVYMMEQEVGMYRIHTNNISKRISPQFLIENLEEKRYIRSYIENLQLFSTYDYWWLRQIDGTLSYYVYGSHPSLRDYRQVAKWCVSHSYNNEKIATLINKYRDYLISYRICRIKSCIKKVLGLS